MTPFLDDPDVTLYQGDALETLRHLPDGSVDMVATSPPFYGLRDYGTGLWEGGDPDCDHQKPRKEYASNQKQPGYKEAFRSSARYLVNQSEPDYVLVCGKCGARRVDRQIGLEETPEQWVANLVAVFRECRRVLADHGTLWVEIGDSYAAGGGNGGAGVTAQVGNTVKNLTRSGSAKPAPGLKPKDLLGQPWMLAFALRADGWYLRSEIIWARPNPMPESVTDRPTKAHSTVFLLSKQPRYFYDADAIREPLAGPLHHPGNKASADAGHLRNDIGDAESMARVWGNEAGANARSVWTIPTEPTPFAHFATWPRKLVARMLQAGTSERGKCPECGKPWERDVERTPMDVAPSPKRAAWQESGDDFARTQIGGTVKQAATSRTVGWSPSCDHYESASYYGRNSWDGPPPVPCVVLDPFAGSGTTLLTARHHGRHSIGIELNPAYCAIAAGRLAQLSLFATPPPEPVRVGTRPKGLKGGAYSPPGQSPHSNARPKKETA